MPRVGPTILIEPRAGQGAEGMLIPGDVGALSPALSWVFGSDYGGSVQSRSGLRVGAPGVTLE